MNPPPRHSFAIGLFDFLAIALVAFPLLTGGIWIERPGLFVELSDLGIPVLVVTLVGLVLKYLFRVPIEEGRVARLARTLWARWQAAVSARGHSALWIGTLAVGALWSLAALQRYWTFGAHAFDLGHFANAIWNLSHGNGYISAPRNGTNVFSDHQSPLFYLFAPIYRLFPRPETLLISQGLGLAFGAVPLYFLAAQYLPEGHWALPAVPLIYWANPSTRNANLFEFHPEVFILPVFLAAIAGLQSARWRSRVWGALTLILALGTKESAGPIAVGVGFAWVLGAGPATTRAFTRKLGALTIGLGMGVFLFDTWIVRRWFGANYVYAADYPDFGSSIWDIVLAPVLHTKVFLAHLVGPARFRFLFWTLGPLAFLPLLNPRALSATIPGYLMLFLEHYDHRISIAYHYGVEVAIGLFWALPGGIAKLRAPTLGLLWMSFWALGTFGRSELFPIREYMPGPHARWLRHEVLPCLHPEAPIAAPDSLVPALSSRPWVHTIPTLTMASGDRVACVIEDWDINNWGTTEEDRARLVTELPSSGYQEVYHCGSLQAWELKAAGQKFSNMGCLRCVPSCPF